jgi:hypothetical protein
LYLAYKEEESTGHHAVPQVPNHYVQTKALILSFVVEVHLEDVERDSRSLCSAALHCVAFGDTGITNTFLDECIDGSIVNA